MIAGGRGSDRNQRTPAWSPKTRSMASAATAAPSSCETMSPIRAARARTSALPMSRSSAVATRSAVYCLPADRPGNPQLAHPHRVVRLIVAVGHDRPSAGRRAWPDRSYRIRPDGRSRRPLETAWRTARTRIRRRLDSAAHAARRTDRRATRPDGRRVPPHVRFPSKNRPGSKTAAEPEREHDRSWPGVEKGREVGRELRLLSVVEREARHDGLARPVGSRLTEHPREHRKDEVRRMLVVEERDRSTGGSPSVRRKSETGFVRFLAARLAARRIAP